MKKPIFQVWKNTLYLSPLFAMLIGVNSSLAAEIPNPIAARSFPALIQSLANALILIATPLAVVALIFAGFKFVTASTSGDSKGLTEAKKMFWWILVGTAIIVGASALAKIAVNIAGTL